MASNGPGEPTAPSSGAARNANEMLVDKISNQVGTEFKTNSLRQAYEQEVANLAQQGQQMLAAGKSEQEVAQMLNQARRDLGVKYKDATPEPLREYIYDVNRQRYDGDPLGPTYDLLKASGKTDTEIIAGAARPNPDVNQLLAGFQDWLGKQDMSTLQRWAQ